MVSFEIFRGGEGCWKGNFRWFVFVGEKEVNGQAINVMGCGNMRVSELSRDCFAAS